MNWKPWHTPEEAPRPHHIRKSRPKEAPKAALVPVPTASPSFEELSERAVLKAVFQGLDVDSTGRVSFSAVLSLVRDRFGEAITTQEAKETAVLIEASGPQTPTFDSEPQKKQPGLSVRHTGSSEPSFSLKSFIAWWNQGDIDES